ncbi:MULTISPECIES: phosphonoacetaldehyde hydrolase [Aneurinibacillus]|uniref:Phosphonoacetaldehyde hydrolase n=1 Tax=Aneurinibacillus thermoaerophilus TaxID=143495 RepID=A0A1G7Y0P6_ANETH|nr:MULTISPECIES: phosphonoacetaldehyde hydrolase [Aneurinibacillus]MED0675922.1 phosphonoacetaldehyde hydrolase [Aneurinibacillus thermoaerophilus]MED0677803.1 phosphonoacetaldehyde hydrolase [Aneurinibacillus thermoaerophilus]MED0737552.1 phosphonoacetaldehyde hydrolase [Aneurinibacillus thermoaerophilus]MED0762879.1 phosphonoacetaldehyde hydrolase [Aneurinibacillus thermoaerophilus]QYY41309.1 phosphonoacetaldehyde hydrolase [Aneurinibacillus thermoaerophilus]
MIQAVIFDWAGTMIDYGCFAPLAAFMEAFKHKGVEITVEEAREPMGLLKREHIAAICAMERVAGAWEEKHGKRPDHADIDELYADFEARLFSVLANHAKPVPGAVQLVNRLREQGMKIGSTTGYTTDMMHVIVPKAKKHGYEPDTLVTPDEVPAGRPFPWMCYTNAMRLGVYPMWRIVKVGDTLSDIQEGRNAGAWTVGVIKGSSELGMTEEEVHACDTDVLSRKMTDVRDRFLHAGAHFVIETIGELEEVIAEINERMRQGERP